MCKFDGIFLLFIDNKLRMMDIVGDYGLVIEELGNSLKESKEMDGIEEWQLAILSSDFVKKGKNKYTKNILAHPLFLDKNIVKKYCISKIFGRKGRQHKWKKRSTAKMANFLKDAMK
jgi:hypothetical protein